jgi:hypothetical protein
MRAIGTDSAARVNRLETVLVATFAVMLTAVASGYALTRDPEQGQQQLLDWQVSAFADLGPVDQAIYSALSVAAEDITYWNYDLAVWPQPEDLASIVLPPFYQDAFWEQNGRVKWQLHESANVELGGTTVYSGTGGVAEGQSGYILVFQHRHAGTGFTDQAQTWVHSEVDAPLPESFRAESLVRLGWKLVVKYSGADEVARVGGH